MEAPSTEQSAIVGLAALDARPVISRGVMLVAVGGVLISFSPVFVGLASVGPTVAGFYRTLFGGLLLAGVAVTRGERLWRGRVAFQWSVAAALFFGLGLAFWHRSIQAIGPGLSTILANLQAFFLAAVGAVSLKERITWRVAVSLPVAIGGLALLVSLDKVGADADYRTGVALGLAAALAYALYILVLRVLQADRSPGAQLANVAVVSLVCAAMMGAEGVVQGESFVLPDAGSWVAMASYGVLCQALAWYLISTGLPRIAAARAGVLLLLQPTGAFLWDLLFFGRPTTGRELVGAAAALIGIYLGGAKK
jgi:drug/metabolite transporter (DMT)-like permease